MIRNVYASFIALSLLLVGCATLPTADPKGQTLIESEPPGARIEINNQYVGTAPLRVNIPRTLDENFMYNNVSIIANPIHPGQQVQQKFISFNETTPTHIFFDMNLVTTPRKYQVDLNQ